MRTKILNLIVALAFSAGLIAAAPLDTAFTYQGRLTAGSNAANGVYDFRFTLHDAVGGGKPLAGPLTNASVAVSDGWFTTELDFGDGVGADLFTGAARWLEISVRTNARGAFSALTPRQALTPTPYALYTPNAGVAATATSADAVASGAVGTIGLQNSAVDSSKIADATINVSDLSPYLLNDTFWRLTGNAGTTAGVNFLGTTDNEPLELKVFGRRALRLEPTTGAPNVVGGGIGNFVTTGSVGSTISGGNSNIAGGYLDVGGTGAYLSIGGGSNNAVRVASDFSTIGGGVNNTLRDASPNGTISGGARNTIADHTPNATIGGGTNNFVYVLGGTIGGGQGNFIEWGGWGTIGGGRNNYLGVFYDANNSAGTIGGGNVNVIDSGRYATIGGGGYNLIQCRTTQESAATIAGGYSNSVSGFFGVIGGGTANLIGTNAADAVIGGGFANSIRAQSAYHGDSRDSTISGGRSNYIQNAIVATIGGGLQNKIWLSPNEGDPPAPNYAVIGGGFGNEVYGAGYGTIGGGSGNYLGYECTWSTIAGGLDNRVGASPGAAIGGGIRNTNTGTYATIPGGALNMASGSYSFASGYRAHALHQGSFVWADSQAVDFSSTANNTFIVRAAGGVGINKNNPATDLHVGGTVKIDEFLSLTRTILSPTAGSTITPASSFIALTPAAAVTLSATTAIAGGFRIGDILILEGRGDTETVTVPNNANTKLGAQRVLAINDVLMLMWNGIDWVEISFNNNVP